MFRRAVLTARPLARPASLRTQLTQVRLASASLGGQSPTVTLSPPSTTGGTFDPEEVDPRMNGNYPDMPRVKRSLRDPYEKWWDPQERRNYNEPLHEDNDILGIFSTESYTHFSIGWGWVLMGSFVGAVVGLCSVVGVYYPDKGSTPRTFPDGLEAELGGPKALPAAKEGSDS